jgi:hypothetical protein
MIALQARLSIQPGLDPKLHLHDIRFTTMSYWSQL